MAKKPIDNEAPGTQDEDLTPYPTQAQNDAAKLGGRKPEPEEASRNAEGEEKAGDDGESREMKPAGGAEYKTR